MARFPWQYIPTQTLDDAGRSESADQWAADQRTKLADDWAKLQYSQLEQTAREITAQNTPQSETSPQLSGVPPGPFSDPQGGGLLDTAGTAGDLGKYAMPGDAGQPPDQGGPRPDVPDLPAPTLMRGPMGGPVGVGMLPGQPAKPAPPSDEDATAIAQGESPIKGADELIGRTAGFIGQQGASRPAAMLGPGEVRSRVPEGSAGGAVDLGLTRAAGSTPVGGGVAGGLGGRPTPPMSGLGAVRNAIDQGWKRTRNYIASQGPAGQELAQSIESWRNTAQQMQGEWTTQLRTVRSLGKAAFDNFVDVAEGKAQPISDQVAKAADEWKAVSHDVYQQAQAAGVPVAGQIENYFPHTYAPGTFTGKGWSDAVDHLVATGQAADPSEAAQMLNRADGAQRNRRYGNLEIERTADLPGYERTPAALLGHLQSAADRIAQIQSFGPADQKALDLITQVGRDGGDAGAVKRLFDIAVGAEERGTIQTKISSAIRGANSVASLGLVALNHATQSINTGTITGFSHLARALPTALSAEGREYAVKIGTTLDNVIKDVRENTGVVGGALGKITSPGFNTVQRFNRTLAVHAGIGYATDLAEKAAKGDTGAIDGLNRLGLDGADIAQRGTLNAAEQATAGRSMVQRTQFLADPQDLPGWASSPYAKVLTQFKTFAYNQTGFLGREIIGPALRRDVAPLARFMVAGLLAGGTGAAVKGAIQGNEPTTATDAVMRAYEQAGGLGLGKDVISMAPRPGEDKNAAIVRAVGTIGGPAVGKAAETYGGLVAASHGNLAPLGRTALRQIPVVGTAAARALLPTGPTSSGGPPRPPTPPKPPAPPRAPAPPGGRR